MWGSRETRVLADDRGFRLYVIYDSSSVPFKL